MTVTSTKLETFVTPAELRSVILDFESYSEFMDEVTKVEVKEQSETSATVTFHIDIAFAGFEVKSHYTVAYEIGDKRIAWDLVESPSLTKNRGSWVLEETEDEETIAHYESELETNLPIPPEIQAEFAKQELPKLMETLRDRAESL